MKYTRKQKKALKVFGEYISCEHPFIDMSRRDYKKLGEYYNNLPEEVFSVPKCNSLYHISRANTKAEKLTESGIVSCTTLQGKEYINCEWILSKGDIWWRLKKRKAIDAKKLYDVACNAKVLGRGDWLYDRVHNEDEYILPLEKAEVLGKKVVKRVGVWV